VPVPVVLVTGVDPEAMAATVVAMQFDVPHAVALRHEIDVARQTLTRTVSDVTGLVEREVIPLEHACTSCAIREDVVPTLVRLAGTGRWSTVLTHLPVGAAAEQVCAALATAPPAVDARVSGVLAVVDGGRCVDDLLGDDLLRERGLHSADDDARGVGESLCGMVEYADSVVLTGPGDALAADLVRTLARPDADVVVGTERLDATSLTALRHDHVRTSTWTAPDRAVDLAPLPSSRVWRADLRSARPFHPARLLAGIGLLGEGRHRSRGCFWLPTRPGRILVWDGAGGQLSVGDGGSWGDRAPFTRIVLAGTGTAPARLEGAFAALLADDEEARRLWPVTEDGFETWLGPLRDVA
jgi:G3E family GTPase